MSRAEGAADRVAPAGTAGHSTSTAILAERGVAGKQAMPPIGTCANCGQRIKLTGSTTTCPTCSAWRRWYIAHRIASRYLREVTR